MRVVGWALAAFLVATVAHAEEEYDIGPLDVLRVAVLGQPEMSGEFGVEADGILNFPFLGRVKASEMTPHELEKKLTTLLSDGYLKRPQVAVSVKEYRSQRIYVTGEVPKPGPYPLHADRTLLTFMGEIGSLTPNAGHEVIVTRPPPPPPGPLLFDVTSDGLGHGDDLPLPVPTAEVFKVNLRDLQSGKPEVNLQLKAGDTLLVPKAASIYVSGFVAHPGPLRYEEGLTVFEALNLAGGVNERGAAGRVKLVRLTDGKKVESKANSTDVLQPGDMLVVPERFF